MKRTESEEECNNLKNAVIGRLILTIRLTFSLSAMLNSVMQSRTSFKYILPISNKRLSIPFTKQVILSVATNSDSKKCVVYS